MPKKAEKITPDDLPRLMETLTGDSAEAQKQALRLLCPCRNRVYDRDVWVEIYRALDSPLGEEVRDRAKHAVKTLEERAKQSEDAQELLEWLADEEVTSHPVAEAIPEWRPRPADGLPVPRWERSRRSKANRRRR